MIRTLRATITYHVAGGVIADVAGVGYLVSVPLRSLPRVGDEVMLFTHHHIREDSQDLYGFTTLEELALFERLLDVSSIGPKSAMAVLAMASANDVAASPAPMIRTPMSRGPFRVSSACGSGIGTSERPLLARSDYFGLVRPTGRETRRASGGAGSPLRSRLGR